MSSIPEMSHLEEGLKLSKQFTIDQIAVLREEINGVATNEQVDSMLDNVFNDNNDTSDNSHIATDKEVNDLLDDIFS